MRFLAIFITTILLSISTYADTLVLNNNKQIKGELISATKNLLFFKSNENIEKYKIDDIQSIYFNEKLEYEVEGNMVYFFNYNFGYKPDTGSTIYFVKYELIDNDTLKYIKKFLTDKLGNNMYNYAISLKKKNDIKKYKKYKKIFKETSNKVYKKFLLKILDYKPNSTIVDGSGNFSIKLPVGKYIVVAISSHRNDVNMAEITGMVAFKIINVTNNNKKLNIKCSIDECSID